MPEKVAAAHYRRQVALGRRASERIGELWRRVDPGAVRESWRSLLGEALTVLTSAQGFAAAAADEYADDVLQAQGITPAPTGRVAAAALAGVASDGRDLAGLLVQPAGTAVDALAAGVAPPRSLTAGAVHLDMIVRTQVADAGRAAEAVAITARPAATGYVRMLNLPSCSRCIVLAGRRYPWNAGFPRHPRCDCRHIPAAEDTADALITNPRAVFDAMDPAEQDKVFTKAGAKALRLGADVGQVVNARRGARGLTPAGARITAAEARMLRGGRDRGHLDTISVFGQDVFVTTEGTTTRGLAGRRLGARDTGVKRQGARYRFARPPRLMPESILQAAAGDRTEAIRLLRRFGYITT